MVSTMSEETQFANTIQAQQELNAAQSVIDGLRRSLTAAQTERDTLYADLERWRAANARQREIHDILYQALKQIDHHIVGAYEVAHSNQPEPCDECIEMREIAEQALEQYRRAMQAQAPGKEPSQ